MKGPASQRPLGSSGAARGGGRRAARLAGSLQPGQDAKVAATGTPVGVDLALVVLRLELLYVFYRAHVQFLSVPTP